MEVKEYAVPIPMMSIDNAILGGKVIQLSGLKKNYRPCLVISETATYYCGCWMDEYNKKMPKLRNFRIGSTRLPYKSELYLFQLRPSGPNNPRKFDFIKRMIFDLASKTPSK